MADEPHPRRSSTASALSATNLLRTPLGASRLLSWLIPALLGLALYGPSLSLPFFWDDVPHFQYLHNRPLAQIWLDAAGTPYYRPLTFTTWRLLQQAAGPTHPLPFHALNVGVWIVDAWLAALLARRLTAGDDDGLKGLLAGTLLVVFPFAAQAVPWTASLSHLLVTLLTLSACICLLQFDESRKIRWGIGAAVCGALAPFASEAGIVSAGLMAACLIARYWRTPDLRRLVQSKRHTLIAVAAVFLLNTAYLPLWALVPKDRPESTPGWVGFESVMQTTVFFLEGLTFPIQFTARWLMAFGLADLWAVAGLGLAMLGLAAIAVRDRRWLMFAIVYCFTAALPAILSLPFAYVTVSPRLMTLTAPGAAILWAVVAVDGSRRLAGKYARPAAALAVAAASLVPAMHIAREVRLHHLALDHLWQLLDETGSYLADQKLLIVNPVGWIAPIVPTYALGHEGVEVMPGYVTPQLLIWAHTQRLYDIEAVTFPLVFPRLKGIYFGTWGEALDWEAMAQRARSVDRVALVDYADDRVEFHYVGSVLSSPPETQARFDARFDGRILLSSVAPAHLNRGAIELELEWSPNAASDEDIFANAFACGGEVLGLSGGAGLGGVYPVWLWQPGERIREVRRIRLDSPSPDGCYRIEMGLFDPQRGERTPAYGQDGARLANDIVPLEFKGR